MKLCLSLAVTLVVAFIAFDASAQQPWLQDRRYGEGIGYRTGNLELHPGIAGELGYDSNYFRGAGDGSPQEEKIDALRLRVTPHLTLSTLGRQRLQTAGAAQPSLNFDAGVYLAYNEVIFLGDDRSNDRRLGLGANLALDILPGKPVGADVYADYLRTSEPANAAQGAGEGAVENSFNRDALRAGGGVAWRPGGGLFEWRFGYEIGFQLFEATAFTGFNNTRHTFNTRGRWRFLPRTALLYDAHYQLVRFYNDTDQNNGETIRSRIGLRGLVTNQLAVLAMAGWAGSFYTARGAIPARNYDDFVANGEVRWFLQPEPALQPGSAPVGLSSIGIGYVRDFNTSYLGAFYRRDRGYIEAAYFIGGQILFSARGGLSHVSYPQSFLGSGATNPSFSENRIDAQLFAEYRPSDTVGLNTTLQYDRNIAGNPVVLDSMGNQDNLKYSRYQIFLGARWFM